MTVRQNAAIIHELLLKQKVLEERIEWLESKQVGIIHTEPIYIPEPKWVPGWMDGTAADKPL